MNDFYIWCANFPWRVFLIVFIIGYFVFLFLNRKITTKRERILGIKVVELSNRKEILKEYKKFIKHNPLSFILSDIRVLIISFLIAFEDREAVKKNIKKIRVVDLHNAAGDTEVLLYNLFLLKEFGYNEEYEMLKKQALKKYVPFKNEIYISLANAPHSILELSYDDIPDATKLLFYIKNYYSGENLLKSGNVADAEKEFAELPSDSTIELLAKQKGYVK